MNQFLHHTGKHNALTENLAVAHSTTGSILADQFSKAGSQRGRDIKEVFAEQSALHHDDPVKALRFVFYLRMVSRKIRFWGGTTEKVQKGQGNRDEAFKRFLWYANTHPDIFYSNLPLFIVVGRFQDFFDILFLAYNYGVPMDTEKVLDVLFLYVRENPEDVDLLKKYMPLPKAKSKIKTERAKFMNLLARKICAMLNLSAVQLRKWKASGTAHQWQQMISVRKFTRIDFNKIPGRALAQIAGGDFLEKADLVKRYTEWIKSQPIAKFTGYPYELGKRVSHRMKIHQKLTVDRQFSGLIDLANQDRGGIQGNVWCALDTSGSMQFAPVEGITSLEICLSLGIYFSTLNDGAFHKHVIMFDDRSRMMKLKGDFTDMWSQITTDRTAWGSTNFQSVVGEIVRIRVMYGDKIPLADYPDTLLVVSDMQFNPTGSTQTNHEAQMSKLRNVFPPEWVDNFRVIWWDVTGRRPDNHPTHIDEGGTYVFSGFDGAVLTLLLGGDEAQAGEKRALTLEQAIDLALNQEILQHIILK